MYIRFFSDIHLECGIPYDIFNMETDSKTVLILAGDITDGKHPHENFIRNLCQRFRAVVYVLGNHEYYRSDIARVDHYWDSVSQDIDNLYVLRNDHVIFDDVRIIGGTLWTDMDKQNPLMMHNARTQMADYRQIRFVKGGVYHRLTPVDTVLFHLDAIRAFRKQLKLPHQGKTVIVSHHLPLWACVHPEHKSHPLNGAYCSDLEALFRDYDFNLWIHGHSHRSVRLEDVYGKYVMSNPKGYPNHDENPLFDQRMLIDINSL